ncbi:ABC transporter ATP-binding protein [Butyrivibrio sp. INlla21]|uniref:ABC transporter ATP-binding protein n=1 Tax=Butyrivibrio sp. INlla21 TaxID=1520811 RepID=UPI0008F2F0AA|nr:ABC transporter ATP-binding protein [Butyrivibrio sp. INlla21]SFU96527.1 ABC-2 type transport system ATP-binding protein [Butyrivibrio sp. INlla21]
MNNLLEIQGLSKTYGSVAALNDVSLSIEPGHIIGLLGPNGSGKTTLIKIICGLLQANSGTVLVDGNPAGTADSRAAISYLPDQTYLDGDMTIEAIVDMFKYFYEDFDENRAMEMISSLNLNPKAKLKTLSKGNQEKVQLMLVMSRRAKLYILDEPIAGVDPAARDYILRTIISNYEPTASMIIATHLISEVEPVLDEAIFLQNGSIKLFKPIDDIRAEEGMSVDELFREVYRC